MPKSTPEKEAAFELVKLLFKSTEYYLLCLARQMKEGTADPAKLDNPREALLTIIHAAIMAQED